MNLNYFWAKASDTEYHPLSYHMIDVTNVALLLWETNIPLEIRNTLSLVLSKKEEELKNVFSAFAGLHDIGKATKKFQQKHMDFFEKLKKSMPELKMASDVDDKRRHEEHSFHILKHWTRRLPLSENQKSLLEFAWHCLYAHHGRFVSTTQSLGLTGLFFNEDIYGQKSNYGTPVWEAVHKKLIEEHLKIYDINIDELPCYDKSIEKFIPVFAGFITLADWIASDETYFDFSPDVIPLQEYCKISMDKAHKAVGNIGITLVPQIISDDFTDAFPGIQSLRPLQKICSDIPVNNSASLTIIEAPTGEGKTEAALHLAQRIIKRKANKGIYVAMPTQATSKGLFDRFNEFCKNVDSSENLNIKLIHGNAILEKHIKEYSEKSGVFDNVNENQKKNSTISEHDINFEWFAQNKRALLAPYGVGTVDQALFSALLVRHFFLRLNALAGKVVIFDEVHAYDFFMFNIFEKLLKHLNILNTDVIILSATLPKSTRLSLLNAWGYDDSKALSDSYPLISTFVNKQIREYTFEAAIRRQNQIDIVDNDPDIIAGKAIEAYKTGARIAIVCNTVKKCQNLYRKIIDSVPANDTEHIFVLHSRFMKKDREKIEQLILSRFGKHTTETTPAIVIATQIIEQSLDIDFDYMISELAPVDLMIQRAGRLHRHSDKDSGRPEAYKYPRLTIAVNSPDENGKIDFGPSRYVYDEITLLRTYFRIAEQKVWNLPNDYRLLVDPVYPEAPGETDAEIYENNTLRLIKNKDSDANSIIRKATKDIVNNNINSMHTNNQQQIPDPEKISDLYKNSKLKYEEDSKKGHLIAKTRDGQESYNICLLFGDEDDLYLDPDCTKPVEKINSDYNPKLSIKFLKNSVSLSNRKIKEFLENSENKLFCDFKTTNRVVRNLIFYIIRRDDAAKEETMRLEYDKKLGLTNK